MGGEKKQAKLPNGTKKGKGGKKKTFTITEEKAQVASKAQKQIGPCAAKGNGNNRKRENGHGKRRSKNGKNHPK